MEIKGNGWVLGFVLMFLFVLGGDEVGAQIQDGDSVVPLEEYDTAYVDSLYDLSVEYVFEKKMFKEGETFIVEGLKHVGNSGYDYAKFTYVKGMIYFLNQDASDDDVGYEIFMGLIENRPEKLSSEYKGLVRLCHQKIAWLNVLSGDEKSMKYHCEKSMEYSTWKDFNDVNNVYFILEDYYREYDIDISLAYAFKRLCNFLKEYVYVFIRLPLQEEKNNIYKRISLAYQSISYCYEKKLDYKTAIYFSELSNSYMVKNSNTTKLDLLYYKLDMGYLNLFIKEYDKSEFLAKNILFDNRKSLTRNVEISCLVLLGDIRSAKKDYKEAKIYYEEAIKREIEFYSKKNNYDYYQCYQALAIADFHLGNYQSTIDYYKKVISLIPNKEGSEYLNCQLQMASAYYYVDKKESKRLLEILLNNKNLKDSTNYNTEIKANIHYMLGVLDENKESSLKKHFKSRELYLQIPSHIGEEALNLVCIAEKNPENKAFYIKYLNEAITACLRKGKEYDLSKVPGYNDIIFPFLLVHAYKTLGDYYIGNNDLDEALEVLKIAKEFINVIKPMYKHDESKSSFVEESLPIYEKIIQVAYEKYNQSQDFKYFELAFDAMDKSKSIHLMDALKNHNAFENAGIPNSLFRYGQELKIEIDFFKEELNKIEENNSEQQAIINDKLLDLYMKYNDYMLELENNHPDYFNLKYNSAIIDINKIRETISDEDMVVQYHVQDSLMTIIGLSKKENIFITENISRVEIDSLVNSFIGAINRKENNLIQENSEKLYKILLSQIISNNSDYSKLIIIPDGILNHLPFELLSKTENIDSRIIYSKSILYNYTASKIYNKGKKIKSKQKFLGIAPTYSNNQFANLPYAKKEIRQISESWDGHILEDEDANLENFKTSSKNYNIVHIAGHTEINDSFPLQSRLVFSELADSVESLYAHELYNMKFDLDMVALSACNTGIGKLRKGEGNMSLARGFAYAGCPSTVTTLWPMVDEPTKDIMTLFYGNLKKGQTKSEALRNAKLTFLETGGPKIQDPIYWSGIVIIGSDIPLVGTCFMNSTRFYIFLTLGTLLIVLFMLKKFRK